MKVIAARGVRFIVGQHRRADFIVGQTQHSEFVRVSIEPRVLLCTKTEPASSSALRVPERVHVVESKSMIR